MLSEKTPIAVCLTPDDPSVVGLGDRSLHQGQLGQRFLQVIAER